MNKLICQIIISINLISGPSNKLFTRRVQGQGFYERVYDRSSGSVHSPLHVGYNLKTVWKKKIRRTCLPVVSLPEKCYYIYLYIYNNLTYASV